IGAGPLPTGPLSDSRPLVPDPVAGVPGSYTEAPGSAATLQDAEELATGSGEAVPEFLAGVAAMSQMLASQFPMGTLQERAVGETVGMAQALVQAGQSLLVTATAEAV